MHHIHSADHVITMASPLLLQDAAVVVADDWQGKGLARRLMGTLIDTARGAGLRYMHGDFLAENTRMLAFVASLGFVLSTHPDDPGLKRGVLVLN